MKKYIEPSILLIRIQNQEPVLAGSLPSEDEEGYGDPMGNVNGRNDNRHGRNNGVWDDFDEEEEDY